MSSGWLLLRAMDKGFVLGFPPWLVNGHLPVSSHIFPLYISVSKYTFLIRYNDNGHFGLGSNLMISFSLINPLKSLLKIKSHSELNFGTHTIQLVKARVADTSNNHALKQAFSEHIFCVRSCAK